MSRIGRAAGPVLIVIWTLVPLLWLASLSLKGGDHITDGRFWPAGPTLQNYRTVFSTDLFTSALRNSIGISLLATALSVVLATLAAYAIARLDFPGKKLILSVGRARAQLPTHKHVGPRVGKRGPPTKKTRYTTTKNHPNGQNTTRNKT